MLMWFYLSISYRLPHRFHLDHIGSSGNSHRYTGGNNRSISAFDNTMCLCHLNRMIKQLKDIIFFLTGNGETPHDIFSWRHTFSEVLPAIISQAGRYLEIILAERPDFVTVTMALAFKSYAVVHVA